MEKSKAFALLKVGYVLAVGAMMLGNPRPVAAMAPGACFENCSDGMYEYIGNCDPRTQTVFCEYDHATCPWDRPARVSCGDAM